MNEVWMLGATGRTARAIAGALDEAGASLVLAGRDRSRLEDAARALGSAPRLAVGPLEGLAGRFAAGAPAVVINTVGPFARTAARVLAGLPPGSHYVDVANEYAALEAVLGRDGDAVAGGQVLVSGAGFGVVANESIVVRLCEGQPPAARVRVDAMPSLATAPGAMGSALAGTIIESLPFGRRQVRDGRLIATPFDDTLARLRTPDGDTLHSANFSSGDLLAAWRASRAQHVVAASSEVPSGLAVRLALPALSMLARSPQMRRIGIDRLARAVQRPGATQSVLVGPRPGPMALWCHARWVATSRRRDGVHRRRGRRGHPPAVARRGPPRRLHPRQSLRNRRCTGGGSRDHHRPQRSHDPRPRRPTRSPSMTPTNSAAWLRHRRAPLEVGPAPYTHPAANEIVVRNRAIAVNPVDWTIQLVGAPVFSWIKPPFVLGSDVAGDVVEVGRDVTRFKVGDRVLGHAVGSEKTRNTPAEGAFQQYTVLLDHMASPIPDTLAYAHAAVLPLGLSTAACSLFQKDQLALTHPSADAQPTGQTLLVWGGATSVGSNAIQLAVAAGYDVITTCSPRNIDYVKRLGARDALDYHSPSVVEDLIDALRGDTVAGAIALGTDSTQPCLDVIGVYEGNRFVSQGAGPISFATLNENPRQLPRLLLRFATSSARDQLTSRRRRVKTKFIWGGSLMNNEVGPAIYETFLPRALAEGHYQAAPDPLVTGHELASIQAALDTQRAGVSAQKIVITLGT